MVGQGMGKKRRKFAFGFAFLLILVWISGCASLNPGPRRENFAPFFIYSEDEENKGSRTDVLGPFFTFSGSQAGEDRAFRPFLYWQKREGAYSALEFLYPLGKYLRTDQKIETYFIPFISTYEDLTQKDRQPKDRTFLLAIWGKTDKGKSYGGLFPLYGKLEKRFTKDEITFVMWPIYSDSRLGENHTYNLFWPFFSYSEGGGRDMLKIWPLYGQDRKENSYEKYYFLWPIFHFENRYLYTDDPTRVSMVFPLSVNIYSSQRAHHSLLWPLFKYEHSRRDNYTEWDLPWPFFRYGKGDEKSVLQIFPLYGRKENLSRESGFFLWPILWYYHDKEGGEVQKKTDHFLILSKEETQKWPKEGREAYTLRIWPFFHYSRRKEGNEYFYSPALIPVDEDGYERNWAPFLTLYEYRQNAQGASEAKFLWGFYTHRQSSLRELYEVSFLLTYYKAEEVSYFGLLKGLLEYRVGREQCALRLLYSPWPIQWDCSREGKEAVAEPWKIVALNDP